jgi:hypothetical protein
MLFRAVRFSAVALERLTEWMRWQAFVNGSRSRSHTRVRIRSLFIDYGFLPGHHADISQRCGPTPLANSDPVADLGALAASACATTLVSLALRIHLTSKTAKLILNNQKLKTYFNVPRWYSIPCDVGAGCSALLAEGTQFIVHDAGFRPMASGAVSIRRLRTHATLPNYKVLITTRVCRLKARTSRTR